MRETIGQRIRTARKAKGLTQRAFAESSGYCKHYISMIENGHAAPSSRALMAFERALKVRLVK